MSNWVWIGLSIASALAMLCAFVWYRAMRLVMSIRLRRKHVTRVAAADVPLRQLELLTPSRIQLEQLGFTFSHIEERNSSDARMPDLVHSLIMFHAGKSTYADLTDAAEMGGTMISFWSSFEGGREILTMDCGEHLITAKPDWLELNDAYSGDLNTQWQTHLEAFDAACASGSKPLPAMTPDESIVHSMRVDDRHHSWQEAQGIVKQIDGDVSGYTWRSGWRYLRQLQDGLARANKVQQGSARSAAASLTATDDPAHPVSDSAQLDSDLLAYRRFVSASQVSPLGALPKLALFVISALIFAGLFGFALSPSFGLALLIVVAVHEFGHALAMKAFGYRDLSVLFLPMFGALAHGSKPDPTLLERTLVSLAGPVPGLIAGIIMLDVVGDVSDIGFTIALLFVVLNYLNLLPLLPLDGGRVVDDTLMSRSQGLQLAFSIVSVAGLAGGAVWLGEPVLMFLALFMGLGLIGKIKNYRMFRSMDLNALRDLDEDQAARHLLKALGTSTTQESVARYTTVKDVLETRAYPRAGLGETLVCLALYAAVLVLPLVLSPTMIDFTNQFIGVGETFSLDDIEQRVASAPTPEAKVAVLFEASRIEQRAERSQAFLGRAYTLVRRHALESDLAADVLLQFAQHRMDWDEDEALSIGHRAVDMRAAMHGDQSADHGRDLMQLAALYLSHTTPDRATAQTLLERALTLLDGGKAPFAATEAFESLSQLHEQQDNIAAAEQVLRNGIEQLSALGPDYQWLATSVQQDVVELFGRQRRFAAAAAEAERVLASLDQAPRDDFYAASAEPIFQLLGRSRVLNDEPAAAHDAFKRRIELPLIAQDGEFFEDEQPYRDWFLAIAHVDLMVSYVAAGDSEAAQKALKTAQEFAAGANRSLAEYVEECESCLEQTNTSINARFRTLTGPVLKQALASE